MIAYTILKPVVALAAWTMVMWAWMYATRIPAMNEAKVDGDRLMHTPGATLDTLLPPQTQWKAHNYNHLHEAPTVFYAIALVLAISGAGGNRGTWVAWAYVVLRVLHSLVQATVNKVQPRFILFVLSTLCLVVLILRAVQVLFVRG
ncbi:MAG: MAPEG family protein [Pseudomonadota bacterium]|nr:MAPEG family protein [Pseudomonadota bacterium]